MCNLSKGIGRKGINKGRHEGTVYENSDPSCCTGRFRQD